jgi:hypothetical protein
MMNDEKTVTLSEYDRLKADYEGLPGTVKSKHSLVEITPFFPTEPTRTWVVQTYMTDRGRFVFLLRPDDGLKLVLPPKVVAIMDRQRDGLVSKVRSQQARERAAKVDPEVRERNLAKARAARKKR